MPIDPRSEATAALAGLLDKFTYLALTLGIMATSLDLLRVATVGWHPIVTINLVFIAAVIVILLLRRKIPVVVVILLLVVLTTLASWAIFAVIGLRTISFVALTVCCVIVGVVFGSRAGFLFLVGNIIAVGVVGYAAGAGLLPGAQTTDPLLSGFKPWLAQIAAFAAYTSILLVVTGTLQTRLSRMLGEVSAQAEGLKQSEERYRLLADNMRDVLFFQDMDRRIQFASPSIERLLGYKVEEFSELDFEELFAPSSRDRVLESYRHHLARAMEDELDIPPQEFEFVRKDGSTIWVEVAPTFLRDDDGQVIGAQGLLRDITVRKELKEERSKLELELHQSEKLKAIGELAGGIAHDFNNQLTPIMVHADLLARGEIAGASVAGHARKILGPARNAADLTAKLLAFARKGAQELRPVDLHEVIGEVVEILSRGIDRRISVKRHFEAASAVVEGDRTQLQNVLLNLGLNARDAMPDGGEIVFQTYVSDQDQDRPSGGKSLVKVMVCDSGCGMDDDVRRRAFEPFFTTKPAGMGTGMGLSAAYGTIASHGGRIEIDSAPERGTVVTLALPESTARTGQKIETSVEKVIDGSIRVLVIDDEDGVREALVDLLETVGCSAIGADCGSAGTAVYTEGWRSIDMVLLDLVLPDMNGREVLAEIQKINPEVRVLLMSGFTADEGIRELQCDGTVEFLEKPFLVADLVEIVTRLSGTR